MEKKGKPRKKEIEKKIKNNYIEMYIIYAFMILLMYFLAGVNKARNFSATVSGLKSMFFL